MRVCSIRRQMKHPLRPDSLHGGKHAFAIGDIRFMEFHVTANARDSPFAARRARQNVDGMPIVKQPAGKVGPNEPRRPGDNRPLAHKIK